MSNGNVSDRNEQPDTNVPLTARQVKGFLDTVDEVYLDKPFMVYVRLRDGQGNQVGKEVIPVFIADVRDVSMKENPEADMRACVCFGKKVIIK